MSDDNVSAAAPAVTDNPAPAATPSQETQPSVTGKSEPEVNTTTEPGQEATDAGRKTPAQNSTAYWRRQADRLARQNDQLLQKVLGGEAPPARAQQTETPEPKPEDFTTYDDYIRAQARHEARIHVKAEMEAEAKRTKEASARERSVEQRRTFEARSQQAAERYADFDEVAGSVLSDPDFPVSEAMAEAIVDSEKGPDLVYWLGSHPDKAREISRMTPLAAARELGRIEATISAPAKRTVTQAPNPPPTLKGGEVPSKNPSDMSMDEYAKWRAAGGGNRA